MQTLSINSSTINRLQERAAQENCSVDDLLNRLLDSTSPDEHPLDFSLLECLPTEIVLADARHPDYPIVYVNPTFEAVTGYRREEVIGKNPRFLQGDDCNQDALTVIREALNNHRACQVELRNYRKDGSLFFNNLRLAPVHNRAGQLTHYVAVQRDITDQHLAEQALKQSEARYRMLADTMLDYAISVRVEPDGTLITEWVIGAFTEITGYDAGVSERQVGFDHTHPDDLERLQCDIALTLKNQPTVTEYRIRHKSGSGNYIWLRVSRRPIWDKIEARVVRFYAVAQDITQHKQAEEALRQSEARLRSLVESQTAYVVRVNLDGRYTYINQRFSETYGWVHPSGLIGQATWDTIITTDHERTYQTVQDCLREPGKPVQVTLRKPDRDGSIRWTLWEFVGLQDTSDAVTEIQCVGFDITRQVQAEADLRHNQQILQAVMKTVRDIVWAVELPSLNVIYVSDAVESIIGRSKHEFYQTNRFWLEITHPDDVESIQSGHDHVMKNGSGEWEYRILRPDGEARWLSNRAWLVRNEDGQPARIAGVATDITDQKQTQSQMQAHMAALTMAANAIVITGPDGSIEWINPAFTRMTGYTSDEATGKSLGQLVKSGLHDRAFYQDIWQTILAGQVWSGKIINRRKDGTLYTEEQTITPVMGDNNQIEHFVAIKQDVTEREQMQQSEIERERLAASLKKEKEYNNAIQNTVAALAHDLRTPLAVISTSQDLLNRYFDRFDAAKRREKLESIGKQLHYVKELLNDLTLITGTSLIHRQLQITRLNLEALCQVTIQDIQGSIGSKHKLTFTTDSQIRFANVDEVLVSRILLNLLSNAVKYSPPGSKVNLSLSQKDQWIVLKVCDQGIGISKADQPHLFEPFYRADTPHSPGGTGLGLSIVHDCVRLHNGRIHLDSLPGQGSTFTIELPLVRSS